MTQSARSRHDCRPGPSRRRLLQPRIGFGRLTPVCAFVALALQTPAAGGSTPVRLAPRTGGDAPLPRISAYDSLLVSPTNARSLLLGTANGLFRSADGGRSWTRGGLDREPVTSLCRVDRTIFAAGQGLLAASADGGTSWRRLYPRGLPNDQVDALGCDRSAVYAVLTGAGLFRSTDDGRSFTLVSLGVGPAIKALALTPKDIIAGDVASGVYLSRNGRDWLHTARGMVMALAVDRDRGHVLAAGWGIARSSDGGRRWRNALRSRVKFAAVAWAPGVSTLAYAVGENRSFWRSADSGRTWNEVPRRPPGGAVDSSVNRH